MKTLHSRVSLNSRVFWFPYVPELAIFGVLHKSARPVFLELPFKALARLFGVRWERGSFRS